MGHNFFGKTNNEGNDDINIFETEIAFKPDEEIRKYLEKIDEYYLNLRGTNKWIKCSDKLPPKEQVILCYSPGTCGVGVTWAGKNFHLGMYRNNDTWSFPGGINPEVESWMPISPVDKEEPHAWIRLGWCCENLYKSIFKKNLKDDPFRQNSFIMMSDTNELFIMNSQKKIHFCPWCGEKIND